MFTYTMLDKQEIKKSIQIKKLSILIFFLICIVAGPLWLADVGDRLIPAALFRRLYSTQVDIILVGVILWFYSSVCFLSYNLRKRTHSDSSEISILLALVPISSACIILIAKNEQWVSFIRTLNIWLCMGIFISAYTFYITFRKSMERSRNPSAILPFFRAQHISYNITHPLCARYQSVAIAQARKLKVDLPELYVFQNHEINALMLEKNEALDRLLVSSGALERLSETELAALIALEYEQFRYGDLSVNTFSVPFILGLCSVWNIGILLISRKIWTLPLAVPFLFLGSFGRVCAYLLQFWLCHTQARQAGEHFTRDALNTQALTAVFQKCLKLQQLWLQSGKNARPGYNHLITQSYAHLLFNHQLYDLIYRYSGRFISIHPSWSRRIRLVAGSEYPAQTEPEDLKLSTDDSSLFLPLHPRQQENDLMRKTISQKTRLSSRKKMGIQLINYLSEQTLTMPEFSKIVLEFEGFIERELYNTSLLKPEALLLWKEKLAQLPEKDLLLLRQALIQNLLEQDQNSEFAIRFSYTLLLFPPVQKMTSEPFDTEELKVCVSSCLTALNHMIHMDKHEKKKVFACARAIYPFIFRQSEAVDLVHFVYDLTLLKALKEKDMSRLQEVIRLMIYPESRKIRENQAMEGLLHCTLLPEEA